MRKFEVVEIVDLVTIARKVLPEKKKSGKKKKEKKKRKRKRIEDRFRKCIVDWGKTNSDRAIRLDRMSMSGVVNFIGHRAFPIRAFSHR